MFNYNKEDAKEKTFICLPAGEYEAQIMNVTNKVSKKGNDMLVLELDCFATDGTKVRVFEYIVNPSALFKLKAICKYTGIEFDGKLEEQLLVGKRVVVKLKIEPEGQYPARNSIVAYIGSVDIATAKPVTIPQTQTSSVEDDDIPF